MGAFKKSPKQDPAVIARLQSLASAPDLQARIQALHRSAGEQSMSRGRSAGWDTIPEQIRRLYEQAGIQIPDGYEVDTDGQIVYTNKTPFLQQMAWGAAPIAGVSALGALAGGAGAAAGGAASGAGAAGGGGALASSSLPVASLMGGPGAITSGAVTGAGGSVGWLGGIKKGMAWLGMSPRDAIGAAGNAFGAASQTAAHNRGEQFAGQMDLEHLLAQRDRDYWNQNIQREQEGRASGADAWRKLLAAQRTLSPGARPQLSPYSVAPRQATEMERTGANAMMNEVMARLQGGNPIAAPERRPVNVDPNLLRPGTGERVSGWLSPVLGAIGRRPSPNRPPVNGGYR